VAARLSPRLSTASDLNTQAEALTGSSLSQQNRYNKMLQMADEAPKAAAAAQEMFSRMPQEADLPAVLQQIMDAADKAGLKPAQIASISTTVPRPVKKASSSAKDKDAAGQVSLATMEVNVSGQGTREQLLDLITNLQSLDRALLVSSAAIQVDASTAEGDKAATDDLTVGGSMYVLQSKLPDLVAAVNERLAQANEESGQK
jgi:hypothetical protein